MYINSRQHCRLENALYEAFPQLPLPALDWPTRFQLQIALQGLLRDKRWPELVGMRLTYGELDCTLSTWTKILPGEVAVYVLPSHLMLASLILKFGAEEEYPDAVMEALLLPPVNPADYADFDDAFNVDSSLDRYPDRGTVLYHLLTPAQRSCVAAYLDLYWAYRKQNFTRQAHDWFEANRDTWLKSTLA